MDAKKITMATIILWLVGTAYTMLTCGWLFKWVYEIEPIIWKSPEAMMGAYNMILANIAGIIISLAFVVVFNVFYKGIPGQGVHKGLNYGFLVWLVGAFSGMISMPLFMTIATTVVVYWIVSALVLSLINGAIVGKIFK